MIVGCHLDSREDLGGAEASLCMRDRVCQGRWDDENTNRWTSRSFAGPANPHRRALVRPRISCAERHEGRSRQDGHGFRAMYSLL